MKITLENPSEDVVEIVFGEERIALSTGDLEHLHSLLTDFLRPETVAEKRAREKTFLAKLVSADDAGIQVLLRTATHDDILILLQAAEEDDALKRKLYGNMTENSIKLYVEDLVFMMREGVPGYQHDDAMARLMRTVEELAEQGALNFGAAKGA